MAKQKNNTGIFGDMFGGVSSIDEPVKAAPIAAPAEQPIAAPAEQPVAEVVVDENPSPVAQPKKENKEIRKTRSTRSTSKPSEQGNKDKYRSGGKRTFEIPDDLYDDFETLAAVKGKKVRHYLIDLIAADVEANRDQLDLIKSFRK